MKANEVKKYTKDMWNSFPEDSKGEIGSAVRGIFTPRRWGGYDVEYVDDWESIGLRTLRFGKKMLVEGFDFIIVG